MDRICLNPTEIYLYHTSSEVLQWLRHHSCQRVGSNQPFDYIAGTLQHTLTSLLSQTAEVNLSKFLTLRYSVLSWPHQLVALPPLSYHYKQKLRVDVIMHRCPVSLPAVGHSLEVVHGRAQIGFAHGLTPGLLFAL